MAAITKNRSASFPLQVQEYTEPTNTHQRDPCFSDSLWPWAMPAECVACWRVVQTGLPDRTFNFTTRRLPSAGTKPGATTNRTGRGNGASGCVRTHRAATGLTPDPMMRHLSQSVPAMRLAGRSVQPSVVLRVGMLSKILGRERFSSPHPFLLLPSFFSGFEGRLGHPVSAATAKPKRPLNL
ncbi:hypothetical protein LZ32DRAFT_71463 [Colletotrichum eremochloae]|nr:hypothetical protein LZ32DRAFT_71463 [Colletotrichum eremochloae]